MKADQTARSLYKKLLALYPHEFREQLGESMEQTFADRYHERRREQVQGLVGFVLWMYVETAVGVMQEHLFALKERSRMQQPFLLNLRTSAFLSFLIVLPFMLLEAVNRRAFNEGFPLPLFGFLWLAPALFFLTLLPLVQTMRAGENLLARPLPLLLRAAFLLLVAAFWAALMLDQMPCFLGVPNCD